MSKNRMYIGNDFARFRKDKPEKLSRSVVDKPKKSKTNTAESVNIGSLFKNAVEIPETELRKTTREEANSEMSSIFFNLTRELYENTFSPKWKPNTRLCSNCDHRPSRRLFTHFTCRSPEECHAGSVFRTLRCDFRTNRQRGPTSYRTSIQMNA